MVAAASPLKIAGRFVATSLLAETGLSVVHRAEDTERGETVCLKLLRKEVVRADPAALVRFRREATVLAGLEHPHIVKVHAFGVDGGQPYLVTEMIAGRPLDELVAEKRVERNTALKILTQLADGLAYVHRRGLVHRDIKPANVLVTEAGSVKLIDFGLAQLDKGGADSAAVGTFRYMPPEQAGLLQRPVGPRSDLYSLGVAAYEMLSGRLPFVADDDGELLRLIQSAPPPSLRSLVPDIPVMIERIVEKLLQKNPDDRYHTAHGLHADLARVLADVDAGRAIASFDLDRGGSALYEKLGAIFVGRERELDACEKILTDVVDAKPRFILVSGRSGVGKSAFVSEIHGRGLSRGLQIAQGKCYAISAGLPYFVLAEALESAHALLAQMPSTQRMATLARLVKDVKPEQITALAPVWRDVFPRAADVKYEGEEKERAELVKSVGALFACIASKDAPLAVFLDDLQWADSGTITLFDRLLLELAGKPVLLLGAYRSEEVGPTHAVSALRGRIERNDVAGAAIEVAPLTLDEVASLVGKLLAMDAPADLVREIHERSSGNAFFVWELLRAFLNGGVIKERDNGVAIDLSLLPTIELPSGLLDVVIKRLRALPPNTQRLLGVAALVGQAFSLEVLTSVLGLDADAVYEALVAAIDAGLVVAQGDAYAFAHDKVLEAAAEIVPAGERAPLHRKIGEFLEQGFEGADKNAELLFQLAEHFGRSDDDKRGLQYAKLAGDKARTLLQNDAALRHYARADEILAARANADAERGEILVKRAEVLDTMGKYAEAEDGYNKALAAQSTPVKTATVLAKLAYMQQKASRMGECHANLLKALALLGVKLDLQSRFALRFAQLRLWMVKQRVRLFPPKISEGDERARLVNEILTRLWYFHAFHDAGAHNVKMYILAFRLLAATLGDGESKDLSTAHRLMAITLCQGRVPDFIGSVENSLRSVEVARKLQLKMELAVGFCYVGVVHVWQNSAKGSIEYLERAQEMLEQIGNLWDLVNAHIFLYMALRARGKLDDALAHALEIVAIAERANAPASLASGAMKVGELLIMKGERERGEQQLERAVAISIEKKLQFDGFNANKIKGRLLLRDAKPVEARAWFEKAIALTESNNFMRAYVNEAYIGWAESVVRDDAATPALLEKAAAYLTASEEAEERYRNYLVYALRVRARLQSRAGERAAAAATLARAREIVEREDLVFERPTLYEDIAELVDGQGALKEKARELYAAMGAAGEAKRLAPASESAPRNDVRTESLLASLLDVTVATAMQNDLDQQARAALDSLVRVFDAERAFLFLADEASGALKLQAGRDAEQKDLAALTAYSTTVVEKVRSERKPIVVTSTEDGALLGSQSAVVYNLRSIMAAPLVVRDKLVGVVYLDNRLERGVRTATELQVFQAISSQIAVFIETARAAHVERERQALANEKALLEKDLALTATVQQLFLPKEADYVRGPTKFAGFYRSADQCGGDWWWVETRRKDGVLVIVGDVMGHGAAPAMVTASVSTAYQLAMRQAVDRPVPEVLEELNATLVGLCAGKYYMTMSAVLIDDDGTARWWNAGAPPLLAVDGAGKVKPISARGSPLGSGELNLGVAEHKLEAGHRLLIFTDGLPELEMPDGKQLGLGKLGRALAQLKDKPVDASRDGLVEALDKARGGVPQGDDLTFVLLHRA